MRYIRTTNYEIEFIEANDSGTVLQSIGLQLGEVYFQIKNKKVAFYLKDNEKPFDNFIWSINLPIIINGDTYETEEEASAALSKLMVLEDLNELKERLDAEILRSTNKDTEHDVLISGLTNNINDLDDKVDNEEIRAISAETRIEQKLDDEIARAYSAESLINQALRDEVIRAVSAETRLDIKIDEEIERAISAETALGERIDAVESGLTAEIERSTDKDNEHDAALSALTDGLNEEVDRAKAAESALTDALNAEIERATNREDDIIEDLDDEFHRAQSAEHLLEDKIATERERAMDVEDELRELIISGGTGSGVTPAEVQTMIQNYTYDKEYIDNKQDKVSIWNGTGMNAVIVNNSGNTASQNYAFAEGVSNRATNTAAHAEGMGNVASGGFSHAEGRNTTASQIAAHTEGSGTQAKGTDSHAEGTYTIANNNSEHASGYYNVSRAGSTLDDKTLFSVGNGTSAERHNAFEIMQNGDIFISSGDTDIKLQDYLGGVTVDAYTKAETDALLANLKQEIKDMINSMFTVSGNTLIFNNPD